MVGNNIGRTSNINSILRYVTVILIIAYIACLLIFTSGSSKPFDQVAGPIEGAINKENLVKAKPREIKKLYDINVSEYDGVLLYVSNNNISSKEVLLVKAKTDEQVNELRTSIDRRLNDRMNDLKGYAPKEEAYIENAVVSVRGKYVFVSIGKDSENLKEVFSNNL